MNLEASLLMSWWKKPLIAMTVLLATGFSYLATWDSTSAQGEISHIQAIAFAEWQLLSPKEEQFSILMPIGNIERNLMGNGTKKEFTVRTEQEAFSVGLWDMPAKVMGNEANLLADIAAKPQSNYRLISQRKFALNGNPGIELNYTSEKYPNRKLIKRCIIAQGTLYLIMVVSDSPTRAQTFLDSFRLK
jgi:hypothetical protein